MKLERLGFKNWVLTYEGKVFHGQTKKSCLDQLEAYVKEKKK